MNILLLGGGGREHALARALAQSPACTKLFAAPGNPGIAGCARIVALDLADHRAVVAFCHAEAIDLVVVGPEAPLVDGIADALREGGIAVFAPGKAAARLEGSKAFTKALCIANAIPTAAYERHDRYEDAIAALDRFALPVVVKADGLAAGKGVTVALTRAEATDALDALFAVDSAAVVIEAFLEGEEVSLFAISDGTTVLPFGSAQDHKRVGDGDTGPNTGGMGAYSPASVLAPALEAQAFARIIQPTVDAMRAAGTPFVGVLYAGLMLTREGPQLIEYNVRLGDPEAQVLLPRFDGDLAALCHAAATGGLADHPPLRFRPATALAVVLAAQGYPDAPRTGDPIKGVDGIKDAQVFIAGASDADGTLRTSGGRILAVTALGASVAEARARAYRGIARIDCPGSFHRHDIGWREIARGRQTSDERP